MKRTFRPRIKIAKRRHGFLKRLKTKAGRSILNNRKNKGRKILAR